MAEWIPYHLLSERELKIIVKSFAHVFPDCQLWFTPLYNYFILVGSPDEIVIDYTRLVEGLSNPEVAEDLREIGMPDSVAFVNTFAMDKAGIEQYVRDTAEINTYDQPRIEFFGKYDYAAFGQLPIDAPAGRPALANLGETGEQERAVRHSVESYNMIARGLIKASYFFRREEYLEAAKQWRKTLAADPDNPAALYMLGVTQKTVKQELNERLARLKQNPNNPVGYFDMGAFCEKIQNPAAAIEMYRKAIELKPDFEPAYNNLGLIYGERGQYETALDIFRAAREINPRSLVSAYNTVIVYYLKGDYKKAELICREALTYPASPQDEELRTKIKRILQIVERTRLSANIQRP
jgi:Flp pilus assembly protein TadD